MIDLNLIAPEIFISLSIMTLLMIGVFLIGHPDWFEWPPIKLFNSEQIFLSVIVIYFLIKGNK